MGQYSVNQVSKWTDRSHSTVCTLLKNKVLSGEKIGNKWTITGTREEIMKAVETNMKLRPHHKKQAVNGARHATTKGGAMLGRLATVMSLPNKKWNDVVRIINLPDDTFKLIVALLD